MQGIIDTGESSCWIVGKDEFDLDEDIFQELKIKTGYRKVASSRLSRLVAHFWIFRLLMKGEI